MPLLLRFIAALTQQKLSLHKYVTLTMRNSFYEELRIMNWARLPLEQSCGSVRVAFQGWHLQRYPMHQILNDQHRTEFVSR
jgi:hypothetical protein